MFSKAMFALILFGLTQLLRFTAWRYPAVAARHKERNLVVQIKAPSGSSHTNAAS